MRNNKNGMSLPCRIRLRSEAWHVALVYAALGMLWILLTDLMAGKLFPNAGGGMQTLKGLVFVLLTSLFIYELARRAFIAAGRKVIHEQLKETEHLLKTVMAHLGDAVFIIGPPNRTIRSCNAAVEQIFGYAPDELIGRKTHLLYTDQTASERFAQGSETELERTGVFRGRYQMRHKNGSVIETENTVVTLHQQHGWEAGVVSIVANVTERVRAEEALRESEKRYRLLADNALDVIWSMDMDLTFTYVNPAIETMTGYTPEEFIGTSMHGHCSAVEARKLESVIAEQVSKGPGGPGIVVETELIDRHGLPIPVEAHGRVIFAADGAPTGLQGTSRDIRRRIALEARVRHAQKLESIGTLASGVAHEINNPLQGIIGYADLLLQQQPHDESKEFVEDIKKEGLRIGGIVRNLLGYARKDERHVAFVPVSLHQVVEETRSLINVLMRQDGICLEVHIPEDLPPVKGHRQHLQQVLMNLLTNARDALNERYPGKDDDKRIVIRSKPVLLDDRDWIVLEVEDQGIGISTEVQTRMFDPFYTTKEEGTGTGLGMWITYGIIKEHDGRIRVESEPEAFTRVCIELPVASRPETIPG